MRNLGKKNIVGILIDAVDYDAALDTIFRAARERKSAIVAATAVHGIMIGVLDPEHKFRLNHFDLLVPDGQPVRWMLNWIHGAGLSDRVYGPDLTIKVCARAANEGEAVYLYGASPEILSSLVERLESRFPGIKIAGMRPSLFRPLSAEEKLELADQIKSSGASILLVGLGCPRQEIFAFEFRELLQMPILTVGAAFPFIAGKIPQAPPWMQARGLEWLYRLGSEPRRLWKRYLYLNPAYLFLVGMQKLRLLRFKTEGVSPAFERHSDRAGQHAEASASRD